MSALLPQMETLAELRYTTRAEGLPKRLAETLQPLINLISEGLRAVHIAHKIMEGHAESS